MTTDQVRLVLWVAATLLIGTGLGLLVPSDRVAVSDASLSLEVLDIPMTSVQEARAFADSVTARDPFRMDRTPIPLRFGTVQPVEPESVVVEESAPAPPIVLVLAAVLGGPPWAAVIEGIPGFETGLLLYRGEPAAGATLLDIRGDTALVQMGDSLYPAVMKRPWQ